MRLSKRSNVNVSSSLGYIRRWSSILCLLDSMNVHIDWCEVQKCKQWQGLWHSPMEPIARAEFIRSNQLKIILNSLYSFRNWRKSRKILSIHLLFLNLLKSRFSRGKNLKTFLSQAVSISRRCSDILQFLGSKVHFLRLPIFRCIIFKKLSGSKWLQWMTLTLLLQVCIPTSQEALCFQIGRKEKEKMSNHLRFCSICGLSHQNLLMWKL